jgi:antitoxin PrlF
MATAVTVKGQVTLPKAVREAAGIKPGDYVEARATALGTVVIEKTRTDALARIEQSLDDLRKRGIFASMSAEEIMRLTRDGE